MADSKTISNTTLSCSLPPGCRFFPSAEQLICYYLSSKNGADCGRLCGFDVIKEIDLYDYHPFDLPDSACFRFGCGGRRRHWYCFVGLARVLKETGRRRRAKGGYWKKMGGVRDVLGSGADAARIVVGTRQSFVFCLGDSPKRAARTDWVMYEYALVNHPLASFVLCRVFIKARRGNNISDHIVSSCGEESVAVVRHIGVQYDGTMASVINEANVIDDNAVDKKKEILSFPVRLYGELDDRIPNGPIAEQMRLPEHGSNGPMIIDTLVPRQLTALVDDDFIELDDLLCPLPSFDCS